MGYVSLGPAVTLEAKRVLERYPHLEGEMVRSGHVSIDVPESRHLRLEGPVDPVVGVTRVAFGIRRRPVLEVEGRHRSALGVAHVVDVRLHRQVARSTEPLFLGALEGGKIANRQEEER